jgi:hypothetical protein
MNRPCEPLQSVAGTATWCGFPPTHRPSFVDSMFSFCSMTVGGRPDVNASERSKKSEAESEVVLEAEVHEATATAEAMCARRCALR